MRGDMPHATVVLVACALVATVLAGCSSGGGRPTLSWYTNPDDGGQAEIARRCTDASGGRYRIQTSVLPRDASDQREQLLRRLAAKDASIDLMSLDPVFVAEFAEAGFLADIPSADDAAFTDGIVEPAVAGATWKRRLVAAPFWANTQLLWFRKSVARDAGLDPARSPVTWAQLVAAAQKTRTTVGVQGKRYEGYTVLVNALVESAGGHVVENPGADAAHVKLGLASPAGDDAARIIRSIAHSGAAGPSLSTADEEVTRTLFQSDRGGFMVNWPYVWRAANAAVASGALAPSIVADIGWAMYPRAVAGEPSRPPLGGIDIGIGHWSRHPDLAVDVTRCITSAQNQTYYFLHEGNPAARSAVFDDPAVQKEFPMAATLRESLQAAAPRPQTQFYGDISAALQREFHPPASVNDETPRRAADLIHQVLAGEALL
jgi:multiple sugar transport system substrate-binding protein